MTTNRKNIWTEFVLPALLCILFLIGWTLLYPGGW